MARTNSTTDIEGKQTRLKSALSYDGIVDKEMSLHLAKILSVSIPIANRMLNGDHRTILMRGIAVAAALNINIEWLYFGSLSPSGNKEANLRTARIHMQSYKGYPKELTDKAMRFNFAFIAGMKKARNLMSLIETNRMNYIEAITFF